MDLTRLTHTLTISGVMQTIDEPVKFDSMKLTMKRNTDYHGISVETTEATLEFYDSNEHAAASLIRSAYEADIDTEITYTVTDASTNTVIYQGVLDLSTYSERTGAYFSVECKVGEMGIKTTFNNRTETEVNLNSTKTIDGSNLAHTPTWQKLRLPSKTITYTNRLTNNETTYIRESTADSGRYNLPAQRPHHFASLKLNDKTELNEFETMNSGFSDIVQGSGYNNDKIGDFYQPIYEQGDIGEYTRKYGVGATYDLYVKIDASLGFDGGTALFPTIVQAGGGLTIYVTGKYNVRMVVLGAGSTFGNPVILASSQTQRIDNNSTGVQTPFSIDTTVTAQDTSMIYVGFLFDDISTYHTSQDPTEKSAPYGNKAYPAVVLFESEMTMRLRSRISQTALATMLPIHEAMNKIVEIISDNQLTVKSDYYGRPDSLTNPTAEFGDGSLKAITSGYRLRDFYRDEQQMPLTFKDLIESLDAIDCIGWGFTTENGATSLRIEKWDYFYQDQLVLTINNPNGQTRAIDTDRVVTELTIGYKKYTDSDSVNSVESIHSEHTYSNKCKSLQKAVQKRCAFIADVYTIEETRRKQFDNDTSEFKYDENTFIFELAVVNIAFSRFYYGIPTNYITDATGLTNPDEYFNMRLTPHRNAARWHKYLSWTNQAKEYTFVSGKMNVEASFDNTPPPTAIYLQLHHVEPGTDAEKGDLQTAGLAISKKEIITIKYPLTITEYQSLKANPYGIIRVDGKDYWLQEASYEFKTGETQLKLIPKI